MQQACPQCGESFFNDDRFCNKCGALLESTKTVQETNGSPVPDRTKKSSMLFRVVIVLLVMNFMLACGLGLFVVGRKLLSSSNGSHSPAIPRNQEQGADADKAFIEAGQRCSSKIQTWQRVSEDMPSSPLDTCADWIDRAVPAIDAMADCWRAMPVPDDEQLYQARHWTLLTADDYESSMVNLQVFCTLGSLPADTMSTETLERMEEALSTASNDLGKANEELRTAIDLMNAYKTSHGR